jgi:ubiquinone/menaquinone biosynthesis C-methylase UbiE
MLKAIEEVKLWEKTEATSLLKQCGLSSGMAVLDLGCGDLHYTIPASIVVGEEGIVFAVDHSKKIIESNTKYLSREGIKNVKLIHSNHQGLIQIGENCIDFLMLYDVIHVIPRFEIFPIINRLLNDTGIFSFLAFGEIRIQKDQNGHLIKNEKGKNVTFPYDQALEKLIEEIQSYGFRLSHVVENSGVHFDHFHSSYHWKKYGEVRLNTLERGAIYNFVKSFH